MFLFCQDFNKTHRTLYNLYCLTSCVFLCFFEKQLHFQNTMQMTGDFVLHVLLLAIINHNFGSCRLQLQLFFELVGWNYLQMYCWQWHKQADHQHNNAVVPSNQHQQLIALLVLHYYYQIFQMTWMHLNNKWDTTNTCWTWWVILTINRIGQTEYFQSK